MRKSKTNIEKLRKGILKKFIFFEPCTTVFGNDRYYCSCGNLNEKQPDSNFEIDITYDEYLKLDFLDLSKISNRVKLECPNCKANYSKPEYYSFIKNTNQKFLEKFEIEENSKFLILNKHRFWAEENNLDSITIMSQTKAISISKKQKTWKLYYKKYEDSEFSKIDLNDIIGCVDDFFYVDHEVEICEDFIYVHDFISRMSVYVSDSKNIDIVNELMSEMKFSAGTEILKKIISAFLGIISYSNLSTVALTKGTKFLFDLMENCQLPTSDYMEKSGATSPLKIFNYLVNLKNSQIQKQLDSDDVSKLGYKYVNEKGKEFNIFFDARRLDEKEKKISINSKNVFVRDEIEQRQISPFIFNKLRNFSDYENLIKYLRFISYEQLISLCIKYDKDFLVETYKLIEFRDEVDFDRIIQFIALIEDFCKSTDINKEQGFDLSMVSKYDFNIYDDCQRMLIELGWDFKKVFFKIKTHKKLLAFHDDLVKHRSYLNDKDINEKYSSFSNKFQYLEEYKGNISVKVINNPENLVAKAKEMKNCAASYVRRVALGEYIAFNVYDNNSERRPEEFYEYMMVLELGKYGLEFVGVKGPCNIYGPDRLKKDVIKFLEENDISYKEVPSIRLGVSNNE
jgi:uncharacterized protein YxeA